MTKVNYKVFIIIFIITILLIISAELGGLKQDFISFIMYYVFFSFLYILLCVTKKKSKICEKCGAVIKSSKKSCKRGNVKLMNVDQRIVYEDVVSTTNSHTEHYRGGFAPKNGFGANTTSETTTRTVTKVPINKKFYKYQVSYHCKKCGNLIYINEEEYDKKL